LVQLMFSLIFLETSTMLDAASKEESSCIFFDQCCSSTNSWNVFSVLSLPVMISSFAYSLPVISTCDVRLYTVASQHMPYSQWLHWHTLWLCPVTFGSHVPLIFFVPILCFLMLYLLLSWCS
jgi:hypothetical protein